MTLQREMPLISIILPTRGRQKKLTNFLNSVEAKTHTKRNVEVIIGVDADDPLMRTYWELAAGFSSINLQVYVRTRTFNLTDDYINRMAALSRGQLIWVMNDDAEILTQNWDQILLGHLLTTEFSAEKPFMIDMYDTTRNFNNNGNFACFPMMTRALYNALGYFFRPEIVTWGADMWLQHVCERAECVILFQDIKVYHHRDCDDAQHETMRSSAQMFGDGRGLNYDADVQRVLDAKK